MYCADYDFAVNENFKVEKGVDDKTETNCEMWKIEGEFCAVCFTNDVSILKRVMRFTNFTTPLNVGKNLRTKGRAYFSHNFGWVGWTKISGSERADDRWDARISKARPTF